MTNGERELISGTPHVNRDQQAYVESSAGGHPVGAQRTGVSDQFKFSGPTNVSS